MILGFSLTPLSTIFQLSVLLVYRRKPLIWRTQTLSPRLGGSLDCGRKKDIMHRVRKFYLATDHKQQPKKMMLIQNCNKLFITWKERGTLHRLLWLSFSEGTIGGDLRSSSFSTCGTRVVTLVTNPMTEHEWSVPLHRQYTHMRPLLRPCVCDCPFRRN